MSDKIRKDLARRELGEGRFSAPVNGRQQRNMRQRRKPSGKNYERLKAERLAREAAKSKEK